MIQLILASASPRRSDLLTKAGLDFRVHPSHVPEDDVPGLSPAELAAHHAHNKARAIAPLYPDAVTLGADTVVVLDGRALGKPRDLQEARTMLSSLSGCTHTVVTAVCLLRSRDARQTEFAAATRVTFLPLDEDAITRYIGLIDPLDKAGAYAAQEHTDRIIQSIDGSFNNVVGLPVELLPEALKAFSPATERRA